MIRRDEMGTFLRARRERLTPRDVGLPDGVRRRTPGLRRAEVAQLAGISVEYYIRLEQARGPHPSRQVLSALGRALMLTWDEREYLFRLAGEPPPRRVGLSREVAPGVRHLLEGMTQTPAYVVSASYDVLAWNRPATHFVGDLAHVPGAERNIVRWTFMRPDDDPAWQDEELLASVRASVADLRAAYGRYLGDPALDALVTELLGLSPRFAGMWAEQQVEPRRRMLKRIEHPVLGPLEFECHVLHLSDTDQRLFAYSAEPGSPTHDVFRRLSTEPVVGTTTPRR